MVCTLVESEDSNYSGGQEREMPSWAEQRVDLTAHAARRGRTRENTRLLLSRRRVDSNKGESLYLPENISAGPCWY